MSESAAPVSSGSESGSSEVASTDSTASTQTSSSSSPASASSGGVGNVKGSEANQVVNAIENAEQVASDLYEVIVDGETLQLTKAELMAGYQKAKSSAKRFQEAAQLKKEAEEKAANVEARKAQMLKNPLKVLMDEGIDEASARKHYEEAVWAWLQEDQMTPEQKQTRAEQKKHETEKQQLAREKAEIEQWKAERKAEKEAAEVTKHQNEYAAQLTAVLSKHNLPESPVVISKLIEYMKDGLSYDDNYSFEDAVEVYKGEHQANIQQYLKNLTPAQLMEHLGPEGVKAFRKQDVEANVKSPTPAKPKPSSGNSSKASDNKISSKDFFANLGKR